MTNATEIEVDKALKSMGPAANELEDILTGNSFHGMVGAQQAQALANQLQITVPQLALKLVPFAQAYAVTPVSNFQVGAVAMGLTGALYFGANLEVSGAALSFTVHAEQSAVANAWVNGEQGLTSLAISAAPCGYCRQFLYELVDADKLDVILPNQAARLLTSFLPDPFGPHDLGVEGGLMQAQANGLTLPGSPDAATAAALAAANASYSPYTSTFAGVAVMTTNGTIVTGRYAENAAYNPSMSPLEAALSQLVFHAQQFADITQAVLVEATGKASQISATETVLACVSPIQLRVFTAQ